MPAADAGGDPPVVVGVRAAVAAALAPHAAVVLAVSGGRDSAVLLDAALTTAPERVRLVATFDHGTGPAAVWGVRHVRALARAAGVPVRVGHLTPGPVGATATEAEWRAARWQFLRRAARNVGDDAAVATGHTADDQLETVVMRLLRGAGTRGLAGMYAPTADIVRPLLGVHAAEVAAYAVARGLAWVDDPSNESRRHLRNRVRHELLPALLRVRPSLGVELLEAARESAACRAELDAQARLLAWRARSASAGDPCDVDGPGAGVPDTGAAVARLGDLAELSTDALAALWPALAARGGVRLDRRGTARLTAFTRDAVSALAQRRAPARGATVAGGARVELERRGPSASPEWVMVVRRAAGERAAGVAEPPVAVADGSTRGGVRLGRWRLRVLRRAPTEGELVAGRVAWLAADRRYVVRAWQPGDRWRPAVGGAARRVKRFLADRRVPAAARAGWPVVVGIAPGGEVPAAPGAPAGEIVWVPGVRRSSAAPARPGQPGFFLLCERIPERRHPD